VFAKCPNYVSDVLPQLEQEKKLAIFLSKGANTKVLQHEVYHVLQFLNGLPFATTLAADEAATQYRNQHNQAPAGLLGEVVKLGKTAYAYGIELPLLGLKRLLYRKLKHPSEQHEVTPGEALRVMMNREKEVDRFFVWGPDVSFSQRLAHMLHFVFQSQLQYLRSYKLD
jgi:hypothetical protein